MLLLLLPALLFALITWQVVTDGPLLTADERLSGDLVHPGRFWELLSDLGDVRVAVPVLALAVACAGWWGRRAGLERWWLPPLAGALTMALVPALVVPLKDWTARPSTPLMPPAVGYFPSGHTATAAVAYGAAALLVLPWLRSPAARRLVVAACAALVVAVSTGLLIRGYHWPLDVVASWCLATVLLTGLWRVISRSSRRTSAGTPSRRSGPS
ncbi:phosphatase PAP2 family protein [Streptomyces sp. NPDC014806]|uniref:phosphatase PAP2 family protein n=1 Tax=Streptomyces sp. NPDC014806 TaxID=3364920 RepID=UPI0036FB9FF0